MGDLNDDICTSMKSTETMLMGRNGFVQLLSTPTTDHGALLDHVYYNGKVEGVVIDVVDCYYSDHDTVFISIPTATNTVVSHSTTCVLLHRVKLC